MKKSTIWVIAIVMGIIFMVLIYLQASYLADVVRMRQQQFDTSVNRALYLAARNLEIDETERGLYAALKEGRIDTLHAVRPRLINDSLMAQELQLDPRTHGRRTLQGQLVAQTNSEREQLREGNRQELNDRLQRQKDFLTQVAYDILYKVPDKPLAQRVKGETIDHYVRMALKNDGINLDFHFTVTTVDGREVFRCADYNSKGEKQTYHRIIFPNDPPAQSGIINLHFPDRDRYIFAAARYLLPAIAFTVILLIMFCFTIYSIFRQKRLTEIKNDFINNMTHEFKTPISSISLAAQMLSDGSVSKSESMVQKLTGVIVDETKRLRFQVEKILQVSLFDRKGGAYKSSEININTIAEDVVSTFRLKVESSGGTIDTDLAARRATIFADPVHITNLLFNLMDNAVKYKSPDRELHLCVSTRDLDHRFVEIVVADNGIGIRRDDLKHIFDRFYRVHTGNRHDVKGFGLGLAYVKNVVDHHKGSIRAESDYGQGTRFILHLPVIDVE